MEQLCLEKLVFPDESGINTNLVRRYGRTAGKHRVVDSTPFSTPKTTIVLSAMRMDRQFACCTYKCGTTKERFLEYSRECLLPALREGDIVVKEVENLLCSVGSIFRPIALISIQSKKM